MAKIQSNGWYPSIEWSSKNLRKVIKDQNGYIVGAGRIEAVLGRVERLVLSTIKRRVRGLTCEQLEDLTGLKHQTASARIYDLRRYGLLTAGEKRNNESGRSATAWVVTA